MSPVDSCSQSLSRRASSSETVITGIPRLCVPLKPWSAPGRIALGFLEIIADGRIAIAHRSPRDGRNRMGTDALLSHSQARWRYGGDGACSPSHRPGATDDEAGTEGTHVPTDDTKQTKVAVRGRTIRISVKCQAPPCAW